MWQSHESNPDLLVPESTPGTQGHSHIKPERPHLLVEAGSWGNHMYSSHETNPDTGVLE